jgi:hypothetical protein
MIDAVEQPIVPGMEKWLHSRTEARHEPRDAANSPAGMIMKCQEAQQTTRRGSLSTRTLWAAFDGSVKLLPVDILAKAS